MTRTGACVAGVVATHAPSTDSWSAGGAARRRAAAGSRALVAELDRLSGGDGAVEADVGEVDCADVPATVRVPAAGDGRAGGQRDGHRPAVDLRGPRGDPYRADEPVLPLVRGDGRGAGAARGRRVLRRRVGGAAVERVQRGGVGGLLAVVAVEQQRGADRAPRVLVRDAPDRDPRAAGDRE